MNTQAKNIESLHDLIVQYGDASHIAGLCAGTDEHAKHVRTCADLYTKIKVMLAADTQAQASAVDSRTGFPIDKHDLPNMTPEQWERWEREMCGPW